jgi:hypothetical protein
MTWHMYSRSTHLPCTKLQDQPGSARTARNRADFDHRRKRGRAPPRPVHWRAYVGTRLVSAEYDGPFPGHNDRSAAESVGVRRRPCAAQLIMTRWPGCTFQAGHASSILVTRSITETPSRSANRGEGNYSNVGLIRDPVPPTCPEPLSNASRRPGSVCGPMASQASTPTPGTSSIHEQ